MQGEGQVIIIVAIVLVGLGMLLGYGIGVNTELPRDDPQRPECPQKTRGEVTNIGRYDDEHWEISVFYFRCFEEWVERDWIVTNDDREWWNGQNVCVYSLPVPEGWTSAIYLHNGHCRDLELD